MSAAAVVERWPLVGRWDELETFDAALRAETSDGVLLFGPASVGKTRLAEELRVRCEQTGRPTLRAVASTTAASALVQFAFDRPVLRAGHCERAGLRGDELPRHRS